MSEATVSILPASSVDRRLMAQAAKYASPEEMSEAVLGALTPAQCIERVREIIGSKTIFDEIEERRILMFQMAEWLDWIKGQRENPKAWAAIGRGLKLLSDQIERSNINLEDVSTRLATDHARMFVDSFSLGFDKVLRALAEREMIVIEENEIIDLMKVGIEESERYIDTVTAKEIEA